MMNEMKVSSCSGSDGEYAGRQRWSCLLCRIKDRPTPVVLQSLRPLLVVSAARGKSRNSRLLSVGIKPAGPVLVQRLDRVLMRRREFTMWPLGSRPFSTPAPA